MLFILSLCGSACASDANKIEDGMIQNKDFIAGRYAMVAGNWEEAAKAFDRAVRHAPRNADLRNLLAFSYAQMNKTDLAFKHYKMALRLDPKHLSANQYIGWAYLRVGNLQKAEDHLSQIFDLCGTNCDEYERLRMGIDASRRTAAAQKKEIQNEKVNSQMM
jgi:tetratricopeptide (TPR) repeat protein